MVPLPDVVVLDLSLPKVHGHDVLAAMRSLELHHLPVVVLSGSRDPIDIRTAYTLYANAYVEKPLDLDGYLTHIRGIVEFFGCR